MARGGAGHCAELLNEITLVGKAQFIGNLGIRHLGLAQ